MAKGGWMVLPVFSLEWEELLLQDIFWLWAHPQGIGP